MFFCFYLYGKDLVATAVPTYCMVPGHLGGYNSAHPMALQIAPLYFYRLPLKAAGSVYLFCWIRQNTIRSIILPLREALILWAIYIHYSIAFGLQ